MDEHHATFYFREILLVLAIAGILVPVLHRLKLSPVLGYLIAGLAIGPYGLGVIANYIPAAAYFAITDLNWVRSVAEFGVMLLLFTIGLELSMARLWAMRRMVLGLGSLQILLTALVISFIARQFENSLETSILLGACLALSSTAIVMQLLHEQRRFSSQVGITSFSILLMQDIAVVPILFLLSVFAASGDANILTNISLTLVKAVAAIGLIYLVGRLLLRPLFKYLGFSHNAEWFMAVILFIVVGAAAITYVSGLSMALGAFLAGLLLSETEYRHEIESIVEPLKGLFLGIFFLSVGMVTDLREFVREPYLLVASVFGLFAIKTCITSVLCRLYGLRWPRAIETGMLLGQGGEFAFMIVSMAMVAGLISGSHGQFFLIVAACSMLLTPSISVFAHRICVWMERRSMDAPLSVGQILEAEKDGHVVIAGFGRVGRLLGDVLEREHIPYVAMDGSTAVVGKWRDEGYPVYYGDARRADLWKKLEIESASAALVTVDDPQAACAILRTLRTHWPMLTIIARAHDKAAVQALYENGATLVVQETLEASLQLARFVLQKLQVPESEIETVIMRSREASL